IPDGIVVVDVDGAEGEQALKDAGYILTATVIAKTGRGNHFIYKTTIKIPPKVGVLNHVDLRGPGSYIVAPPSRHANGSNYEWMVGLDDVEFAEAPDWVAQVATQSGSDQKPRIDTAAIL